MKRKNLFPKIFLFVLIFLSILVFYRSQIQFQGSKNDYYFFNYVILIVLIIFSLCLFLINEKIQKNIALTVFSLYWKKGVFGLIETVDYHYIFT